MSRLPLRAVASAVATSLVLLALLPLLGAVAQEGNPVRRAPEGEGAWGMERHEWVGTTQLSIRGLCPERSPCVGGNSTQTGTFVLVSGGGDGLVTLTWRPADPSLGQLRVRVAGAAAEGTSPLVLDVGSLPAGTYGVQVETVGRVAGLFDQRVDWTAAFSVAEAPDTYLAEGASAFRTGAACLPPVGCDLLLDQETSVFQLPWTAFGTLEARWETDSPWTRELRVTIEGADLVAEGASPLRIDFRSLPMGEYVVLVEPLTAIAGVEQEVSWKLVAQPVP